MASQRKAGVALGYANIAVKNVVNLLYTPMLLAFIGQGEYGVYQTAYQFVCSLQLLSFGFSAAYVRFYTLRKIEGDEAGIRSLNGMYLVLYLAICVLAVVVGLVFSGFCGQIFSESFSSSEIELAQALMAIMTFNIATTLMSTVFDANIVSHERFSFQQTRQILTTLATPGFALVLLVLGMGAIGVALAQLAVNVVLLALNAGYAIRKLGMRFDVRHLNLRLLKALAFFSAWLFANQLTDLVNMNLSSVVLGAVSGASVVAVFAIAMQLRSLFYSVSTTLSSVFVPMVNRIVADSDDNAELTRLMTRVGRYQAILYCWVLGAFVLLGQWFVGAWAGEAYSDAYWLTLIMVVPLTVPLIQNMGIEIQKAKNRHKARSIVYLASAILNIIITYLFSPYLGYWAAAIGFASYIVVATWLFMNWYYQKRIGLDMAFFWKSVSPVLVSFAVITAMCGLGVHFMPVDSIIRFLFWGFVYSVVYGAAVWLTALTDGEKASIIRKVPLLKGRVV